MTDVWCYQITDTHISTDPVPPGCRVLRLGANGTLETSIHRLAALTF